MSDKATIQTEQTVQTLAAEAGGWFETAYRGDTGEEEDRYIRTKDGCPEWVTDLVREAHGEMFPDDWKYNCIDNALEAISQANDPEDEQSSFADSQVDVYTHARYTWLASNLTRQGYIDDAVSDLGMEPTNDVAEMIGWGQYMEASEIYGLVLRSLEAQATA